MSVVTEILSLRQNRFSSVSALLAALGWQKSAYEREHILYRGVAVTEAADVAAYAAEQLGDPPAIRKTLRAVAPFRRKPRRVDPGQLHQRRFFA